MSKISLLCNMLNFNLVRFGIFYEPLSVGESMVPYFGRPNVKMFIRKKSIRFGYKIWCLCESDGYSYYMKIYEEKQLGAIDQSLEHVSSITWFLSSPLIPMLCITNFILITSSLATI